MDCAADDGTGGCVFEAPNTCRLIGAGKAGRAGCAGDGPACDHETFETRCDGTWFRTCAAGHESRLSCDAVLPGSVCRRSDYGDPTCVSAEGECSREDPETCDGDTITFCAFGQRHTFRCASVGFPRCLTTTTDRRQIAWCGARG